MTENDNNFLSALWQRLTNSKFSQNLLFQQFFKDGGHDVSNLSQEDLKLLADGRFVGDWKEPAWAASELLAYYSVPVSERTNEQVVTWVFAAFVLADSIAHGDTEWDTKINFFFDGFYCVRSKLEPEEIIYIFQRLYAPPADGKR